MKTFDEYLASKPAGAILLLGSPGVGKTTLATQLPRPGLIELDNNIRGPLKTIVEQKLKTAIKFDVPHIDASGKTVPRQQRWKAFAASAATFVADPSIDTIVVDSLTLWQQYLEDEVRLQQGRKMADNVKTFVDEPLAIQDWRPFAGLAKECIIMLKSTGKRIVFIGHIDDRPDESKETPKDGSGALMKYVNFPGQLRLTMAGLFDDVWFMTSESKIVGQTRTQIRTIQTATSDFRDATLGLKTSYNVPFKWDVTDLSKLDSALSL